MRLPLLLSVTFAFGTTLAVAAAQSGPPAGAAPGGHRGGMGGMGGGHRHGAGAQRGRGMDPAHRADMEVFRFLLDHRQDIRREVTPTDDGVVTLTESDKPEVVAKLRDHVRAMYARMDEGRPIHQRDPLFRELFANRDKIHAEAVETPKGMKVVLRSSDPYGVKLARAHAEVLNLFVKNGHAEVMKDHAPPAR